nr:UGT3 [Ginkgo biloba]
MDFISSNIIANGRQLKVLMFPWLAHGHISPFIELSKRLAEHGINVSFLSTPLNISKIGRFFADYQNTPGKVQLVEVPLPSVDGLPAGIENTADLPPELMPLLHRAMTSLEEPLERLLHQLSPDCVVYDTVQFWTPRVAAKFGIPTIYFVTFGAAYFSFDFSPARAYLSEEISAQNLARPPPGYPSSALSLRLFEARSRLSMYIRRQKEGMRGIDYMMSSLEGCSAMAIKSCHELEEKFIRYFARMTGKPVLPVGPLLHDAVNKQSGTGFHQSVMGQDSYCLKWLENQPPSSVVFVSFGSEYFLSKDQIRELVLGLEASQQPFICVLRFPRYSDNPEVHYDQQSQVSASLPEGFEGRIMKKGLVVGGWVPQKEILSHPSTGGFVTHCGWSSILEGMSVGLPLIALSMQLDQGLNARLIAEELKVGVEVGRGSDGSLDRDEICKAVRMVMVEEEGRAVRLRAEEMGFLFRTKILNAGSDGSQNRYIDEFVNHLYGLKASFPGLGKVGVETERHYRVEG